MSQAKCAMPQFLHGADYNPEQWLSQPEILEADIALMQQAKVNCVSLGIFAWTALEPAEGVYQLDWLADIIDRLYANGIATVLATPSGAKPHWMAQRYPEILRTDANRIQERPGGRHNHCYTSPIYREKVRAINTQLANRFAKHPGVILWHVSNELQGECHCPLCQAAFRTWLQERYGTLDALNAAYWTAFWSHTYTDWSQIESPAPNGETNVHGLTLDWKRFCTAQTVSFFANEIAPLKAANPAIPVTTNFMGFYDGLDYTKLLPLLDVVSWDSYPTWHNRVDGDETGNAIWTDFYADYCRSLLGKPFLLMENTPAQTNWHMVCRPKQPQVLRLSAIAQLAHGADSIQYFQWRQSRGCSEKFHGAVVSHSGRADTRVFQEVCGVGHLLESLKPLCGGTISAKVALLYDVENHWALRESKGPRNDDIGDHDLLFRFYRPFWTAGIAVDVRPPSYDFTSYAVVCVPMLYLLCEEVAARLIAYAKHGGTLLLTYHTGLVNETDLCYLGDTPACGIAELAGIRYLETDPLYPEQTQTMRMTAPPFPMAETYVCTQLCERIAAEGAEVLAVYDSKDVHSAQEPDGMPCLTRHAVGKGTVYYLAACAEDAFFSDFLMQLAKQHGIEPALQTVLPAGVCVNRRTAADGTAFYCFQNWTKQTHLLPLLFPLLNAETGACYERQMTLSPYDSLVCVPAAKAEVVRPSDTEWGMEARP